MQFNYEIMFEYKGIFFVVEIGNLSSRQGIVFDFSAESSGEALRALSDSNDTRIKEIFQWFNQHIEYFECLYVVYYWEERDAPIQEREKIRPLIETLLKYENTGAIREIDNDPEDDLLFQEGLKEHLSLFDKADRGQKYKGEVRADAGRNLKWIRRVLELRDGAKCTFCGATENLEVDHIFPVIKGGTNEESNLQLLCKRCNLEKGDKILSPSPLIKSDPKQCSPPSR